jgi:tRNA-Thr(GGU) m(6)t(6)A37 methyltransferase TsaA
METVTFIGIIHSSLKNLEHCPLQEHESAPGATVDISAEFAEAARDIKQGDKLILLTWLDRGDRSVLMTHPRNDKRKPVKGVFSTRSPDRPNPIGIHVVEVSKISGSQFEVSNLEVLDQTPVIDIKSF